MRLDNMQRIKLHSILDKAKKDLHFDEQAFLVKMLLDQKEVKALFEGRYL